MAPATATTTRESIVEWAERHWKTVALVAAPMMVGGIVYWVYAGRQRRRPRTDAPKDTAATAIVVDATTVEYEDEKTMPTPALNRSAEETFVATSMQNEEQAKEQEAIEDQAPEVDISQLTEEKRDELAQAAKNRGNKYYSGKKYEKAADLYSQAIAYYPKLNAQCAVFYSNRAACYANLNQFDRVIDDCTTALQVDPTYVKAMLRRANAYEKTERITDALYDLTTACMLEGFKNHTSIEAADRLLKLIATARAQELYKTRNTDLPSLAFISAYVNSFHFVYKFDEGEMPEKGTGDDAYIKAVKAFRKKDWEKAYRQCRLALESESLSEKYKAQAYNMRGTFLFLTGETDGAKADYEASVEHDPTLINSLIKLATISLDKEGMSLDGPIKFFDEAEALDPKDPDIYYHRGQLYFLSQDSEKALEQYEKCIAMDSRFYFAKIQRATVLYRMGRVEDSERQFAQLKMESPNTAEIYYYHGEILLDQGKTDEALREFDRSIRYNAKTPLPYLNKGIIYGHLKNDLAAAEECTQKAIEVDNRCDLAYTHLAQMYLTQGKVDAAMITYKRAVELSRTMIDLENSVMGLEAARAQTAAIERIKAIQQQVAGEQAYQVTA